MKEKTSALHSVYIIDGIPQPLTPAEILADCLPPGRSESQDKPSGSQGTGFEPIVDETTDPSPSPDTLKDGMTREYLSLVSASLGKPRLCPPEFAWQYTKGRIAKALVDSMWMRGHFRLGDLALGARWRWNCKPLGAMAAFYDSVEATAEYLEGLGIYLTSYSFNESEKGCQVLFKVSTSGLAGDPDAVVDGMEEEIELPDSPFGSEHPSIGRRRAVGDKLVPDFDSWIIFVPFDGCDFRLGHSLLCESVGENGDPFPEIGDPDYFIDCFEVVREFVEDKVVISAMTVGDGGMVSALEMMCSEGVGASIDISGVMKAYGEKKGNRVLFSEVPGALIQVRDLDYDYIDAEFLLQDVAYFPLGHPVKGDGSVKVRTGGGGISEILQSLLSSQASEGED